MPGLYGETMDNLERIKVTHPNLYNVWKVFLEKKGKNDAYFTSM